MLTSSSQLDSAVDASKEGEVVVSPQAWELIRDKCEGEQKTPPDWHVLHVKNPLPVVPAPSLPRNPAIEPALRCHIQKVWESVT